MQDVTLLHPLHFWLPGLGRLRRNRGGSDILTTSQRQENRDEDNAVHSHILMSTAGRSPAPSMLRIVKATPYARTARYPAMLTSSVGEVAMSCSLASVNEVVLK